MKKLMALIALCTLGAAISVAAQSSKTTTKMLYHGGPVLTQFQDVYVIWYGCWNDNCGSLGDSKSDTVIGNFLSTIGGRSYMSINSTYTDAAGQPATNEVVYGGSVFDASYSHGTDLTDQDIRDIIQDQFASFALPQDPFGIYVVIASADVASTSTNFCVAGAPPYHGRGMIFGGMMKYIFLGNPNRCPSVAGPQFYANGTRLPTPHDTYAGDTIASNLAHALNTTLTNPLGNAWFDRYGLENADKCQNTFGTTFLAANGARANIHLGAAGDYLIQQNWVNDRKARCAMSP